jgi:hypothetical protein
MNDRYTVLVFGFGAERAGQLYTRIEDQIYRAAARDRALAVRPGKRLSTEPTATARLLHPPSSAT